MAIVEELAFEIFLRSKGIPFEMILHAEVDDALEKSDMLEIPTDAILKALLLKGGFGEALAVLPASRLLDMKLVGEITGDHHVRFATETELNLEFHGFELGSLPPAGELLGIPTFVDATVFQHPQIIVSSGRRTESLMLKTEDLFRNQYVTAGLFSKSLEDESDPLG